MTCFDEMKIKSIISCAIVQETACQHSDHDYLEHRWKVEQPVYQFDQVITTELFLQVVNHWVGKILSSSICLQHGWHKLKMFV